MIHSRDVLLGERLAARLSAKAGDEITLSGRALRVSGILSTGGSEDDQIVAPIALAQEILGKPGAVQSRLCERADQAGRCFGAARPEEHVGRGV